jgi:hypothetical protein
MSHLDGKITSGVQPNDLPVEVGGAGSSGLQEKDKAWDQAEAAGFDVPLGSADSSDRNPQGDQPSFTLPAFANGEDVRKTYVAPKRGA